MPRAAQTSPRPPVRRRLPRGTLASMLGWVLAIGFLAWIYGSGPLAVPVPGPPPSQVPAWTGPGSPLLRISPSPALDLLAALPVKGRAVQSNYRREAFGEAWLDLDLNGCDTRNDVLRRDLSAIRLVAGSVCEVAAGTLADPYTGRSIAFSRGAESSSAVQIDHMVALGDAWQTGAQQLTADQRASLANDPLNLVAVDGPTNVQKSDGDAATWLPPNRSYRCQYVARQISVKAAYRLWLTPPERDAIFRVLRDCPGQRTYPSGYR